MKRRRVRQNEAEEALQLEQLLDTEQNIEWADDAYDDQELLAQEEYQDVYPYSDDDFYSDEFSEEYSEEHEAADSETRFRIAMGVFDLISILIGIVVILVLVGMLVTLLNWLRTDILHSALFLQSGLQ